MREMGTVASGARGQEVTDKNILTLPTHDLLFIANIETRYHQVGAVLFHIDWSGERKPSKFWSRSLNEHEKKIVGTVERTSSDGVGHLTLRPCLLGRLYLVSLDWASLRWFQSITDPMEAFCSCEKGSASLMSTRSIRKLF